MGKLLVGRFGEPPDAESIAITLRDCNQRLGLKPSDFVSSEPPEFFSKARGAHGKYLVFEVTAAETVEVPIWKPGYYLLPLEAADALKAFAKITGRAGPGDPRPFQLEAKATPPDDVLERARRWAVESQPLLFNCHCPELILRLDPPWGLRRHWSARLTCPNRCVPPLKTRV
jgi:hypothetical protein